MITDSTRPLIAALGLAVPDDVDAAHAIHAAASKLVFGDLHSVDPTRITDPDEVRQEVAKYAESLALRDAARGVHQQFEREVNRRLGAAWRAAAPGLLAQVRDIAKPAAATITKTSAVLDPDDTPATVLALGGDAVKAWREPAALVEPAATLDACVGAVRQLTKYTDHAAAPLVLWFVDATDRPQLEQAARLWDIPTTADGPGGRWLALAARHTLDPVDADGYTERVAQLAEYDATQAAHVEQARQHQDHGLARDRHLLRAHTRRAG